MPRSFPRCKWRAIQAAWRNNFNKLSPYEKLIGLMSKLGTMLYVFYDNAQWMCSKNLFMIDSLNKNRAQYKINAGFYWSFGILGSILSCLQNIKKIKEY